MSEIKLLQSLTYPSLGMKTVNKNTHQAQTGQTITTANSTYMIHFGLTLNTGNYDGLYKVRLRFRQSNNSTCNAYVVESTEGYLNGVLSEPLDYYIDGSTVYREVDLTGYFGEGNKTKYFSIITSQEIKLYTTSASTGYKPELTLWKIEEDDLVKHQVHVEGSINNDRYQVNIRSGKMYYDKSLISVKTKYSAIDLSMSYNLNYKASNIIYTGRYTGLGFGFKFNYQQMVYSNGSEYIYIDDRYMKHSFVLADNMNSSTTNKVYYEKSGTYTMLEVLSSGYRIKKGNVIMTFNANGMLTKISKQMQNNVNYEENIIYDSNNRITKIESGNYYISITYQSTLVTITTDDERKVYIYINNDLLTKVTDEMNRDINYEYEDYLINAASTAETRAKPNLPSLNTIKILSGVSSCNNKVKFNFSTGYKVNEAINYYNNNETKREELTYLGKITNVKTLVQGNYLATYFVYEFDDRGFIETSYEIIEDKIGSVRHYEFDEYKNQVISLTDDNKYTGEDIEILETLSIGTDRVVIENVPKGDYLISFFTKIDRLGDYDIKGNYICNTNVHVNGVSKKVITLDHLNNQYVSHYITLSLDSTSDVSINVKNTLPNHQLRIMHIYLAEKPNKQPVFTNTLSGQNIMLSTNNGTFYKDGFKTIKYNNSTTMNNIQMNYSDFIETKRYFKHDNIKLVWYNNGQNLLYGLSSASVSNGINTVDIYSLEGAMIGITDLTNENNEELKMYDFNQVTFDSTNMYINQMIYIMKGGASSYWNGIKETYDKHGNFIKREEVYSDETVPRYIEQNVYDYSNNKIENKKTSTGLILSNVYEYNDRGLIQKTTDGLEVYNYENNVLGSITKILNGNIVIEENEYYEDLLTFKKTKLSDSEYNSVSYSGFNIESIKNNSIAYLYEFDDYGRLKNIKEKIDENNVIVLISYDYILQLDYLTIKMTNGQTLETKEIKYDRYGRVVEVKENGIIKITNQYGEKLVSGQCYTNSSFGRLFFTTINSNKKITYKYDKYGYVREIVDNTSQISSVKSNVNYNSAKNSNYNAYLFIEEDEKALVEISQESKIDSNKLQYSKNSDYIEFEQTLYSYKNYITLDQFNRLYEKSDQLNNFNMYTLYEYKQDISSLTTGNTTGYLSKEIYKRELQGSPLSVNEYEYDRGLITKKIRNGIVETYTYDSRNRIKSYTKNGITKTYSYDEYGNIYFSDKTVRYEGTKIKEFNGKSINYLNGNMVNYGNINISFANNRLMSYNGISFTYDGLGRRTCKEASNGRSVWSYYVSDRLYKETIIEGTSIHNIKYIYGVDGVLGFVYDGQQYIYRKNVFKDVEAIYNSSGTLVAEYSYDPFGNTTITTNVNNIATINPFRYRGYYYDVETGLFMVGHRYYNPEWGRWIQPDDVEYLDPTNINGLNLYAYCNNDPVNMYDPCGHFAISAFAAALLIGIGIGAAFGAGFSLAGALAEGETGWDLFWDVAGGALMGAAVGATAVLGGAAGLASVGVTVSGYTLTASAALGYSMLATAAGGMVKYGFDYIASPNADQFSGEQLVFSGINGAIQGVSTFLIAYTAGKNGIFNNTFKLNLTRGLKSSIIAFSKKLLFSTMPAAISRFLLGSIIVNERK